MPPVLSLMSVANKFAFCGKLVDLFMFSIPGSVCCFVLVFFFPFFLFLRIYVPICSFLLSWEQ